MKTGFSKPITFCFLILGVLFLSVSLSCSFISNSSTPSNIQTSSVTQTSKEGPQITSTEEFPIAWKVSINNTVPNGFAKYPGAWINTGRLVPPYLTIFPSYTVKDVAIIPPISPELNATLQDTGLNFKIYQSYIISEDFIYALDENQQVIKIDLSNGQEEWKSEQQGSFLGVGSKNVYINRADNRIFALDKNSGQEKWHLILNSLVPSGSTISPVSQIISYSNLVIVPVVTLTPVPMMTTSNENGFFALNEDTGEVVWEVFYKNFEPLFLKDGVIFSRDYGHSSAIAGFDASTGDLKYSISYLISEDNSGGWNSLQNIDYFNPSDGALIYDYEPPNENNSYYNYVAINVVTGKSLSAQELEVPNAEHLLFREINDKYIIFSTNNKIYLFDIKSGNKVAEINEDRPFASYISQSNIAVISFPDLGITRGIDLTTQKSIWESDDLKIATDKAETYPYRIIGDTLLISDPTTHNTTAYNILDGKQLWNKRIVGNELVDMFGNVDDESFLSDFCKVYNGLLFCADIDTNKLSAIEPSTGNDLLNFDSISGFPMTIQHVKNDYWLVQDSKGYLALMRLINR